MALEIRKILGIVENLKLEGGRPVDGVKVAVGAVVKNPYAGKFEQNLERFYTEGEEIGDILTREAQRLTGNVPFETFGKGAVVGLDGELEHAAAILHMRMGLAMRRLIGGGKAQIPSTAKRGPAGAMIDVPVHYKDAATLLSHYDTIEFSIPDGPRPDEILIVVAYSTGIRPGHRLGGYSKDEVKGEDRYAYTGTMVFSKVDENGLSTTGE